ncbi:hypothetical protein AGOR_G00018510 [Albula goreensis]|uniref:Uncharacterized protein n=1 Tax=Albula goreensis TaxID=1534307 RepID=A0A8T3E1X8_9TELE|nr:hypothetical protein AGOR_G00018510 [Albula goreensis]
MNKTNDASKEKSSKKRKSTSSKADLETSELPSKKTKIQENTVGVKRNEKGQLIFEDFPQFQPNMTPKEVLQAGSFGAPTSDRFTPASQSKIIKMFGGSSLTIGWKD